MKKRIYILLYTLSLGGAERHASSIANFLSARGYDVSIILLQNNRVEYELLPGVQVVSLSDMSFPPKIGKVDFSEKLRMKLYKAISHDNYCKFDRYIYIKKLYSEKLGYYLMNQPEISNSTVISFMTIPNLCAAINKRKLGYKLILAEFTSPQYEFEENSPENFFKKKYFPYADGFVFQTEEQKSFYSFCKYVKKCVIPNPIENIQIEPFCGIRKKEIVNYCKHVKAKNLPLLIKAFAKLSRDYPDYSLVIYGDGPEKTQTEKCIEECGVCDKVFLKPYASNVLELVRESAMFVSSSDREGISNSMLEAMAIGLPVICTDCPAGGPRMFIDPYVNGLLVPVGDEDSLYRAMKYVIDNPDEADRMSKKAVEIRNVLEKNSILNQWLDFINNI